MKFYLFFSIIYLLYSNSTFAIQNNTYYLSVQKEGVYKVKIPNTMSNKNLFLHGENGSYQVFTDKNYVYLYCPIKGIYQISTNTKKKIKTIKISPYHKINNKKYYKYGLSNSLNENHWFTDIISEGKSYKTSFKIKKSLNRTSKKIQLKLYNFKKSNAPIIIKINNKEKHYNLDGNGDHFISIPIKNNLNVRNINVEIISLFHDVGIESIKINSFLNTEIVLNDKFEKYVFSSPFTIKQINDEYFYFTLKNNKLNKVIPNSRVSNLLIQKKSEVAEVSLKKATLPSNKRVDFLVLYNGVFENKINDLKEVLNNIDSNLSYNYINVQDIYNKYSYSSTSSESLKKYLHYIKPKYVLLVGDASIKNDEGNLIPTFYYNQFKGNTRIETDYTYSYRNDPANPIFSISRLPFKSLQELEDYMGKLKTFLKNKAKKDYVIYDDINVLGNVSSKHNVNYTSYEKQNSVKKFLGYNFIPSYINGNSNSVKTFQFTGHASFSGWSDHKKVEISNMGDLKLNNIFILIDLSCWTGTFAFNKRDSFTESLIKLKNRGSVTSFSVSGYSQIRNYEHVTNYFLNNRNKPIGSVIIKMKKELFRKNKLTLDDIHAYNLFGIPTLKY